MGRSFDKEVVKECSKTFASCGESSEVMDEKDERGVEGAGGNATGAFRSCLFGHLGRR